MLEGNTLIHELSSLSYAGIWVVSLLSNIVIPIPEEITLLALGYVSAQGQARLSILIPIIISGLLLSDIIIFLLAKKGSKVITWLYEKLFSKRLLSKGQTWINAHIGKIIFFSRFLMQLRFIGPVISGQKKIPLKTFVMYDLFALILYVPLYVTLGMFFHDRVENIISNEGVVKNIGFVMIGILVGIALLRYISTYLFAHKSKE